MGIRKRIRLGFVSLGLLLLIAGIISYFELASLDKTVSRIVDQDANSVALSRSILDVVASQDMLVIKYMNDSDSSSFAIANALSMRNLNSVMEDIKSNYPQSATLDSLIAAKDHYIDVINQLHSGSEIIKATWYLNSYKQSYLSLSQSTKEFMNVIQQQVVEEVERFNRTAYRSIMHGIISIAIAIMLMAVLYYLIDLYYITPIVKITKGVKNHLSSNLPFDVNSEAKDEVLQLKELIEQLIKNMKALKNR